MSAQITITLDSDRLIDREPRAIQVERVSDYAPACLAVRTALEANSEVSIEVRNRTVASWLTAFARGCSDNAVSVHAVTPRTALAEKWRIALPAALTDAEIMQARLLDLSLSARAGQSFNDLILSHFYHDILTSTTFPVGQIAQLLNDYDESEWRAAGSRAIVSRTLNERIDQWSERAQNEATRSLIATLRSNPEELRRNIARFRLLKAYPKKLIEKVMGSHAEAIRKAKVDCDVINTAAARTDAGSEIEYYLTSVKSKITGIDDFLALLSQMSGCLDSEFSFLEDLLRERPEWISPQILRAVERRFQPIGSRLHRSIAALRKRIKPAFPREPQGTWYADQWLEWVEHSYMPYYAWLEIQNQSDDQVAEYASQFADWFFENFVSLKNGQPKRFSFTALYRQKSAIQSKDAVTLALILDNFNYVHLAELRRLFRAQGISLSASEPLFSLVPTATEVSKASLIATRGDQVDLPTSSYPGLIGKEWPVNRTGAKPAYLPNIGALQQLKSLNSYLYFLNYLPIDEALHQDANETGKPHDEVVYDLLATVAQSVAEFAKRFNIEKRLNIYVLSDHGSTRIAQGVVNVLDASFYKGLALKNHHRFVALTDEKLVQLPQMATQQCYVMDRKQFNTNHNYLVAKQYYRFLQTSENFYVHGGLSPEEVVVPFAHFTFNPIVPLSPTMSLCTLEFRYAVKSRIPIELGNPNPFPLDSVTVRLLDLDAEEATVEELSAKSLETVELTTTFRKSIGGSNTRTLRIGVRYSYQDTEYAMLDKEIVITMKSIMEEKDDFRDIF